MTVKESKKEEKPKNIIDEAIEELRLLIVLRRRGLLTKGEYKAKLKEIENRLGL
ncbi:MAG TPA: hypothetical protein VIK77_04755 [Tissierellaceae bacterium]